jgi:uncharacterized protein (TIGR02646 family)
VEYDREEKGVVEMIPVKPKQEPKRFDARIRQRGVSFLASQGIPPDRLVRTSFWKGREYWRDSIKELHKAYYGVCAYLGIYLELEAGGVTVDHFRDKASHPSLAYEWSNFRLASARVNSRKGNKQDVLDPFDVPRNGFHLELVTGRIYPNPKLDSESQALVQATINRLKLDSKAARRMRLQRIRDFLGPKPKITAEGLKRYAPFIHAELKRQNLL